LQHRRCRDGDIFISEGHSGQSPKAAPDTVARISRFTQEEIHPLLRQARLGAGRVQDAARHGHGREGRLFRRRPRQPPHPDPRPNGTYIAEWKQFSRPSGIALRSGLVYVADSESNGVAPNPGWKRGIRVGDATGKGSTGSGSLE